MNWITRWKKIGIKVQQIFKKQPTGTEETDWKSCPQCNKIKKINKSKNLVIGFGITNKTISSLKKADGLVVGSALCKKISESIKNRQNPVTNVSNMVKNLRTELS